MKATTPPPGTITAAQFRNLQSRAGIQNRDLAALVKISTASISKYRAGTRHPPLWLVEKLREIAAKPKMDVQHVEAAAAAGIRHLMESLYPHWKDAETNGHIFTG